MKIVILTQNYVPDLAASSFRMKALAEELQQRGHEVAVITGTPTGIPASIFPGTRLMEAWGILDQRWKHILDDKKTQKAGK